MMNEKNFNEETEFDFDKTFEPVGDEAVNVEEPDASAEAAAENASTENGFDENSTSVTETSDGQEKNSNESESVDMAQVEKTDSENAGIANDAVAKAEALAAEFSESIKERTRKAKKEIDDDVDAIKGQRADKKKIGFFSGIRFKITAAFIIPVLLMIVLGAVSYSRSAEALTSSYEATAKTTVDTTADYLDMVIETIRTSSYDIAVSSIAREYYGGAYSDDAYNESRYIPHSRMRLSRENSATSISRMWCLRLIMVRVYQLRFLIHRKIFMRRSSSSILQSRWMRTILCGSDVMKRRMRLWRLQDMHFLL